MIEKTAQVIGGTVLGLAIFLLMAWAIFTLPGVVFIAFVIVAVAILRRIGRE